MNHIRIAATLILMTAVALALPTYTGYSGAPGTNGTCAGTCHGTSGGTIDVVGFPATYQPGDTYVISVVHHGGSTISNFNASVRIDTGPHTAGAISAGYLTSTYNTGGEPNGVHLTSANQDSCTFNWQAPDTSAGEVRLYLAGLQGSISGPNTVLVLTSSPATGTSESTRRPAATSLNVVPTIADGRVSIRLAAPRGSQPTLRVTDASGRMVARIAAPESDEPVLWLPLGRDGKRLAAGTYIVVLQSNGERLVRKLVLK